MSRYYYQNTISSFLSEDKNTILGKLTSKHEFTLEEQQRNSWLFQIELLKKNLNCFYGTIVFEYSIPRIGKRIDCVILIKSTVFAIEFKVGSTKFDLAAKDQVLDYALDLKNFHEQSHHKTIVPILICTSASTNNIELQFDKDNIAHVIECSGNELPQIINTVVKSNHEDCNHKDWLESIYKPTPTIIEAAQALYGGHSVEEISRSDSGAINLSKTASAIHKIIDETKKSNRKSICFLTGVPGAGKTLAGLNLANSWHNIEESEHAVFLSGNGPLVDVLREALSRNEVLISKEIGIKLKKSHTISKAKAFIQNIHHFRDDAISTEKAPVEGSSGFKGISKTNEKDRLII